MSDLINQGNRKHKSTLIYRCNIASVVALIAVCAGATALADDHKGDQSENFARAEVIDHQHLRVLDPWSNYRIGGDGNVHIFFEIYNRAGQSDRLLNARSPNAPGNAELIAVEVIDGRRVESVIEAIPLPAESGRLELSELGYFIRLRDVDLALTMGSGFPLELEFQHAGKVRIQVQNRFHPPGLSRRIHNAVQAGDMDALRELRDAAERQKQQVIEAP